MTQRNETKVCGRIIGTDTGWDEVMDFVVAFYDFEPAHGVDLPKCSCLCVDYISGTFEVQNDEDQSDGPQHDLLDMLTKLPNAT
jgi:hypothetical protein